LKDTWPDMVGGDKLFGFRLREAVKGRLRVPLILFVAGSHRKHGTL